MKKFLFLLLGALLASPLALTAKVYKNPAQKYGEGSFAVGFGMDSQTQPFPDGDLEHSSTLINFTIGIGKAGALGLHAGSMSGSIDGGEAISGSIAGISYQQQLDQGTSDFSRGFNLAYMSGYGETDSIGVSYWRYEGLFGAAKKLENNISAYFGGGLSFATVGVEMFYSPYYYFEDEASTSLAGFVGIELQAGKQALLGAELHLLNETGFGLYADMLF
ncbi:MAG: hypothetical protein OEZ59_00045 [Deltaproteobacteria bacterium]|nr:hypothetical protein [Deltaproteobacteria bacterium]